MTTKSFGPVDILKTRYESAKKATDEFSRRVATEPFEALKWVNSAIEAAATVLVYGVALTHLEKGVTTEAMLARAKENVLRLARSGHMKSTGALEAPLHAEELRAWAAVVDILETGDTL